MCLRHLWGKSKTLGMISIHGMFTTNLDKALGIPSVAITSVGRRVDQRPPQGVFPGYIIL